MQSAENNSFNNVLNCLNLNEQVDEFLSEIITNIDLNIESLNDSREYLQSQVKKEDQLTGSYISQLISGQNNRIITKPFFKTEIGLTPPTTDIQEQKKTSGSFDFYDLKRQLLRICSMREVEMLKEGIGRNVLDIERRRLSMMSDKAVAKELATLVSVSFSSLSNKCDRFMMDKIDWMGISCQNLNGRISPENCRRIWEQTFNPEYPLPRWTEEECAALLRLTKEHGYQGKWVQIAASMPMKIQPYRCFKKWLDLTRNIETSEEWNAEDDSLLCDSVNREKSKDDSNKIVNWNTVSLSFSNRSGRDCERRWNSLQVTIVNRSFTQEEDFQLLLLIKRMGMENWSEIARHMDQRSVETCQRRYCEVVEELIPWTYMEDRQLWLYLRPRFRDLWHDNEQMERFTNDLTLFKSIIHAFQGRCPVAIRHRYIRLIKWFSLWDRFYMKFTSGSSKEHLEESQTTSLLSDICPEKVKILGKIRTIILKTSFFETLRNALVMNGSENPDGDANQLMNLCKSGDCKLLNELIKKDNTDSLTEFLYLILDLQNGIFIPRQFEKYIPREDTALKYPDRATSDLRCLSANVRALLTKSALGKTLRNRLADLSNRERSTNHEKECIQSLLDCEGHFNSALNFAASSLQRTHDFNWTLRVIHFEKMIPQLTNLMIQYIFDQKNAELVSKSQAVRFSSDVLDKRNQIAELLIYRSSMPEIHKTYPSNPRKTCFITQNLPGHVTTSLLQEDMLENSAYKIRGILTNQQQHPSLDRSIFEGKRAWKSSFRLLTPNKASLNLLRTFLLQKRKLLNNGQTEFSKLIRLRYDHPFLYLQNNNLKMRHFITKESLTTELSDPRYRLLRSRIMSVLAVPSIVAKISPFTAALIGDKLHEAQNDVKFSADISKLFNTVKQIPDMVYRAAGSTLFYGHRAPSKNTRRGFYDDDICTDSDSSYQFDRNEEEEEKQSEIGELSDNYPMTRRSLKKWIVIFLPDCRRYVFVSRNVFQPFIKENFVIESVNGNHNIGDLMVDENENRDEEVGMEKEEYEDDDDGGDEDNVEDSNDEDNHEDWEHREDDNYEEDVNGENECDEGC